MNLPNEENPNNFNAQAFKCTKANDTQREAIFATDGPLLIIAGPGTGKTYTLIQRALNLIVNHNVKPENIMMATFTEKAAKELVTRISNELGERNIPVNVNEMYIGTFHSICLRIIKEHIEYSHIKKNFKTLDDFDQKYIVFRNMWRFHHIKDFAEAVPIKGDWNQALEICKYVNNLTEELVNVEKLKASANPSYRAMGEILSLYQEILEENNYLDFSGLQTEAYWLMKNNVTVLDEIREKIQYLMIDEYQDTNYIQEQITFLIAGERKNICVVGDDDQGLYRFRGATIRNILEFPYKFKYGECKVVKLEVNYRSNSDIVDFYNAWMLSTDIDKKHSFEWDNFRHDKHIRPHEAKKMNSKAVLKIATDDGLDAWCQKNLEFIRRLQAEGQLKNLNQIAYLFRSVKGDHVKCLANYFENNGINVYSPRSDMFFERKEVKLLLGCLVTCFSDFCYNIQDRNFKYLDENLCRYYESCLDLVTEYFETEEGEPLAEKIGEIADYHSFMEKNTDYAFSGLAYQLFAYEPFASILNSDMHEGVVDLRPARNISLLTSILSRYEYLHRVDVFSPENIEKSVERFFNMYIKFLMRGGIDEYEDESEYAPSGCVSFLTIHQSKGMEFPIVVVGSLSNVPRTDNDDVMNGISQEYFQRPPFEPFDTIKFYDFWRLYYTAFSRAQNLLVLTASQTTREPSLYFREIFNDLPMYDEEEIDLTEFQFSEVKNVDIKQSYSFTSDISVYEECALQYKFFKELEFTPIRVGATIFGTIVHETIEDIHRAALRNEEHLITPDNIHSWLDANYATVSKAEHSYLGKGQIEAAYNQIQSYVDAHDGNWACVKDAEVEVSLLKPDYILTGKIDLIRGDNGSVEVLDFKSEKKPDETSLSTYMERYKKQLQVYAHLVEEKTGANVSKLTLYYTGETDGDPTVSFEYNKDDINKTIEEFDNVVHAIQSKKFSSCSGNQKTCSNCDFRYYCKKEGVEA